MIRYCSPTLQVMLSAFLKVNLCILSIKLCCFCIISEKKLQLNQPQKGNQFGVLFLIDIYI